ncbi:RNA methylase family UPF0020 protein [Talaromyces stipitatus ATCC 10500]|uniref:tRNA (guanine(10)-N(2))-methyltransferase n=1 Tax=Talaromyces stipitatus (strain ATCC 10500 / CBS 375.48 / QM 6759 / NRRL 1006) TaxID=441959 RepID=B8LWF7_TALSN|nr:RNA methylase family UPF0020 protein [Talaromyces stipitatus ATCC 10500]EED24268.1 RNA methylase family UPF0020 protein [Talaromyces stipitatus ATCC 10500]
MECVIRFAQSHETFRQAEIEALATLAGVDVEFIHYDKYSPFCIAKFPNMEAARKVISRSILAQDLYELWGRGKTHEELHADVRRRTEHRWNDYKDVSFRFFIDTFSAKRSQVEKKNLIESFGYLDFQGPIKMKNPDEDFVIFEDYVSDIEEKKDEVEGTNEDHTQQKDQQTKEGRRKGLKNVYFGRWICASSRHMMDKYDLKKRKYISTTSMDAELSLVTANMAHAAPGKIFFDPFVGTGSFLVAAAYFGAATFGADIDGRSFKGRHQITKENPMGIYTNFQQYGTEDKFLDAFMSDLTNTPIRDTPILDGIICDPPYGIREGLKVLGLRDGRSKEPVYKDGVLAHTLPDYVPPKKPYGFVTLQHDILDFAARTLVVGGRIAMWMPTANDQDVELIIPTHPRLEITNVGVQQFSSWSRRLLTYRKLAEGKVSADSQIRSITDDPNGVTADELNEFRRKYFTPKNIPSEKSSRTEQI